MAEAVHDAERLAELQALPLDRKIQISQARIIEWYNHYHGNVVVSFSGGKDSTVLLHMVRKIYPHVKAVFSNTGLEYPEIQRFVKAQDNVDIVTPTMRFNEVISTYGYPLISKEVAEAIYYARRICSQTVNVERERGAESRSCGNAENFLGNDTAKARRTAGKQAEWKKLELGGEGQPHPDGNSEKQTDSSHGQDAIRRRTELRGGGTLGAAETARRRNDLEGKWGRVYLNGAGVVGTHTNHARETDGSYQGSEVPPG